VRATHALPAQSRVPTSALATRAIKLVAMVEMRAQVVSQLCSATSRS
jgi:hypothetical protein